MKIKVKNGIGNVFKHQAEERERKQRSRERCKALGITGPDDPTLLEKVARYADHKPVAKPKTVSPDKPLEPVQVARKPAAVSEPTRNAIPGKRGRVVDPGSPEFGELVADFLNEASKELRNLGFGIRPGGEIRLVRPSI